MRHRKAPRTEEEQAEMILARRKRHNAFVVKKLNSEDQRISTCSDCRYGIFHGQEHVWTSRGLVHTTCESLNETKTTA